VQGVDEWVATRHARIVLIDGEDGVRATITASWLIQIGWGEVAIHTAGLTQDALVAGPDIPATLQPPPPAASISPQELQSLLARQAAVVLDLGSSLAYRKAHIPGAWFAIRARFQGSISRLPGTGTIVLAAPDDRQAAFAAADLQALTDRPVRVLAGGTQAWREAGLPVESGDTHLLDATDDVWRSAYNRDADRDQAFHDYLTWEIGLLDQLARDGTVAFRRYP
jgi:rhodanese-related sulfurtransferase